MKFRTKLEIMMPANFKHPLSGTPQTIETRDKKGNPKYRITPVVLTPLRAKAADGLTRLLAALLCIWIILTILGSPDPDLKQIAFIGGTTVLAYSILAWFIKKMFRRWTTIVMTTESISVRRWFGWQRYDRNIEHRFALQVHDLARDEQLQHDLEIRKASAKGQVIQTTAYYGESFHVVLLHAGHRIDLLSVYGYKESTAIIARLQYCDRCLNEAIKMGGGISQRPEDDWNRTPGGLSDA